MLQSSSSDAEITPDGVGDSIDRDGKAAFPDEDPLGILHVHVEFDETRVVKHAVDGEKTESVKRQRVETVEGTENEGG
jgi:hypothetical protein